MYSGCNKPTFPVAYLCGARTCSKLTSCGMNSWEIATDKSTSIYGITCNYLCGKVGRRNLIYKQPWVQITELIMTPKSNSLEFLLFLFLENTYWTKTIVSSKCWIRNQTASKFLKHGSISGVAKFYFIYLFIWFFITFLEMCFKQPITAISQSINCFFDTFIFNLFKLIKVLGCLYNHQAKSEWNTNKDLLNFLTGLWRIMETLFFCSIILKSWRRSGAMFLSRKYSGLFSSTLSKYLSLWGAVGGGEVTTSALDSPFIILFQQSYRRQKNKN